MIVRSYREADRAEWLRMRRALWPPEAGEESEAEQDAEGWLQQPDAVVLVAEREDGDGLAGFAEVGRRNYADGCNEGPVAFLEGWYVDPDLRMRHVGADLIKAAEVWARAQGYREMASDALLENVSAHRAHLSTGFEEVERSVKFRKLL